MKIFIYITIILLLISCNENYANLPSITEKMLPTQEYELPFDLVVSKNNLPNKIKKIYQIQNDDTLNILQFDNKKNLIFKYYKQYQGEFWHDKFVFMIEANIYSHNKLIKTYYLHSNVGYEFFEYEYDGNNIDQVKSYKLDNIPGVNVNQYSFIKNIKNYESCISFVDKLNSKKDKEFNYKIKRDFDGNTVKEYYNNEDSFKLFKLNNKREIERIEYYAKNKKWNENTKYFEYDSSGKLIKTYSINLKKDTLQSSEYKYNKAKKIIVKKENGFEISRKEFVKNSLIFYKYQGKDSSYYGTNLNILDKYGFQTKVIEKSREKDTTYLFKNHYEFYK